MRLVRLLSAALATTGLLAGLAVAAVPAGAATPLVGRITSTLQHRDGSIAVTGWAFDRSASDRSVTACLAVAGTCVRSVSADRPSAGLDRAEHISGRHAFAATVPPRAARGLTLALRAGSRNATALDAVRVLSPGARIVAAAKRFVGHARYVEGGASPRAGFDCSGYTQYVFGQARVAALPHNAEAQRHVSRMRTIPRSAARPGDLVFYLSGGTAYHVAIYAGGGKQYAAATPQDGIRYQPIWSSAVEFRTDWH